MNTETINWIDVKDQLPDDEMTVLIHTPTQDEPTWLGYHRDRMWYYPNGNYMRYDAVKHWAEIPAGPSSSDPANPQALSLEELKKTDGYKKADSNGYNALVWFKRGFKQAEKSYGIGA